MHPDIFYILQEAIMMLEQSVRDFKSLIERLKLLRAFENADESNR